jgi:arginyl-tRNA synthetase
MFLEDLKLKIVSALGLSAPVFSYPPNSELGDLSLACFEMAKQQKKNPAEMASELAKTLAAHQDLKKCFSDIKAVGPYVNFFIFPECAAARIIQGIKKEAVSYGQNKNAGGKKVMIEYSNGNTHKEYHVGHLRNIAYGDAINNLLAANGWEAIPVSYINDFGIHVAKTIWNWRRNPNYDDRPENKGYLLGKCYAAASQELAANPEYKEEVGKIMTEIEHRSGANYEFWQKTRQWSIDYFAAIYKELDIKFQHIFYENEVIGDGLKLVQELLAKGILKKSEGAIIADLEKYDLGVLPIIRSDGTALYPVADLALASEKFKDYDLSESIYVVDVRQSLYFKQLFKILELMGYKQKLVHLVYDFVTLPGGMMASRTGNVVTYQDLKEELVKKLTAETAKRHQDWSQARIAQVANNLAISTMKFEMLKVGSEKIITFNIEEASKFDGYTACYLQYGYARLQSIIRKEGFSLSKIFGGQLDFSALQEQKEKTLLIKAARYPEIIATAGEKYNPSEVAKYLFELTQLVNDYYHEVNILKSAPKIKQARLALIKTIAQVLKNGLDILGIKALEEM